LINNNSSFYVVVIQVSAHAELAWVLACQTPVQRLRHMIQFKEKNKGLEESNGGTVNAVGAMKGAAGGSAGLFTYPVLQTADIVLYGRPSVQQLSLV
jgi:tryptophanyl-tRNA synthetase